METKMRRSFTLDPEVWELARKVARLQSRSMSSLVTYCIKRFCEDEMDKITLKKAQMGGAKI